MTGASRQKKLRRYEVTLRRQVEYARVVLVDARCLDEAVDTAANAIDGQRPELWGTAVAVCTTGKAKVLR